METRQKEYARDIFMDALRAADPCEAVKSHAGRVLSAYERGGFRRLIVAGFGKASPEMARAIHEAMGEKIEAGIAITKYGAGGGKTEIGNIRVREAGHPVPDANGLKATEELKQLVEGADKDTMVVCLISGGGSALLTSPHSDISLSEKQEITRLLLNSGADINEQNAVRKHLSAVKGGNLTRLAWPARVISLIISDVIGDKLDVIASGPTAPDDATYEDALEVLNKYAITKPENVLRLLKRGVAGEVPETPKSGDRIFERVENIIVANNRSALIKAKQRAVELGYPAEVITDTLKGDIKEAGRFLLAEVQRHSKHPVCLISGGETTVVVKGRGTGGRNMHLALFFAMSIEGKEGITLLSAGTDGTDGPTDAAGAVVDGNTVPSARAMGITPEEYFEDDNSYNFFKRTGDILITGPTGTNVMDIQVLLLA